MLRRTHLSCDAFNLKEKYHYDSASPFWFIVIYNYSHIPLAVTYMTDDDHLNARK